MITASEVFSFSNFDYLLQVSSNSFHDDGEDVIVILERKNGQKAMVIPFFSKTLHCFKDNENIKVNFLKYKVAYRFVLLLFRFQDTS